MASLRVIQVVGSTFVVASFLRPREAVMKKVFLGSDGSVSAWRVVSILGALALVVAFLPRPVGADAGHTLVHIADPGDATVQAGVVASDVPGEPGRLVVQANGFPGHNGGKVKTELVTPADPIAGLIAAPDGELVVASSVLGVATRAAGGPSYLRFVYIHRQPGEPPCDTSPVTSFAAVEDLVNLWVPAGGQAQIEFPIIGAGPGKSGPLEYCIVAYLLSGGPVHAGVNGPFD
jgi:hypothetical protein